MPDWPYDLALPTGLITIEPHSACAFAAMGLTLSVSGTWAASNRAIFYPFRLTRPFTAVKMFLYNGATVSGNVDLGIYDTSGTRLISTGSTAQAGVSSIQVIDITDTRFGPGVFYLAIACDNTTATIFRASLPVIEAKSMGVAQMSAAFPLPAAATFATISATYSYCFGLTSRSVV